MFFFVTHVGILNFNRIREVERKIANLKYSTIQSLKRKSDIYESSERAAKSQKVTQDQSPQAGGAQAQQWYGYYGYQYPAAQAAGSPWAAYGQYYPQSSPK